MGKEKAVSDLLSATWELLQDLGVDVRLITVATADGIYIMGKGEADEERGKRQVK